MVDSYRGLKVWQSAMDLAAECYEITRPFPREELFGLTSQIRRASSSVAANIAEGYGRDSKGDFVRFLRIAQGSLKETETHLLLAQRVGLLAGDVLERLLVRSDETGRMLRALYRRVEGER